MQRTCSLTAVSSYSVSIELHPSDLARTSFPDPTEALSFKLD